MIDGHDATGGVDHDDNDDGGGSVGGGDVANNSLCVTVRHSIAAKARAVAIACVESLSSSNKSSSSSLRRLFLIYFGAVTLLESLGLIFDDVNNHQLEIIRKYWLKKITRLSTSSGNDTDDDDDDSS
jgi:hypothetical protein